MFVRSCQLVDHPQVLRSPVVFNLKSYENQHATWDTHTHITHIHETTRAEWLKIKKKTLEWNPSIFSRPNRMRVKHTRITSVWSIYVCICVVHSNEQTRVCDENGRMDTAARAQTTMPPTVAATKAGQQQKSHAYNFEKILFARNYCRPCARIVLYGTETRLLLLPRDTTTNEKQHWNWIAYRNEYVMGQATGTFYKFNEWR